LDIIKNADWIIDMGPEGGHKGGRVIFEGTPQQIVNAEQSLTGLYLRG
jgi:excinuclease UvrABC ATPase subunit